MGGFLKIPTPSTQSTPSVATTSSSTVDAEKAARQRRVEALERQQAGRAGTITTTSRGLLLPSDWIPQRKSLLGE